MTQPIGIGDSRQVTCRFYEIFDYLPDAVVIVSERGEIESINSAGESLFGYKSSEAVGNCFSLLMPAMDRTAIMSPLQERGTPHAKYLRYGHEVTARRKDGSVFPADLGIREIDITGRRLLIAFASDLTWRKRADEERRRHLVLLKAQQEASRDGIMVLDENLVISSMSRRFQQVWKIEEDRQTTFDALLQHILPQLNNPTDFQLEIDRLVRDQEATSNMVIRLKDGRILDTFSAPATSSEGRYCGRIFHHRDITRNALAEEKTRALLSENRLLARRLINAQEEERKNLARELHDELGQSLTAIKTDATVIAHRSKDGLPEIHEAANSIVSVVSSIYDAVHSMMRRLRPPTLDDLGLVDTLHMSIANWRMRHPWIPCDLRLSQNLDNLGEAINIAVYRIIQESLTNVVRHATASRVLISVSREKENETYSNWIRLVIKDDGRGMPAARPLKSPDTLGLLGMRERVEILGGELKIESAADEGVCVTARIPLNE